MNINLINMNLDILGERASGLGQVGLKFLPKLGNLSPVQLYAR